MRRLTHEIRSSRRFKPKPELNTRKKSDFFSVTGYLLEMSRKNLIACKGCGRTLDLMNGIVWQGPEDVTCCVCGTMINIRSLIRVMKEHYFR